MSTELKHRGLRAYVAGYKHIELDIRRRIVEENWPAGAMLPGRETLAREYKVSIGTVQRAVTNLMTEGLVYADKRRGTFVAKGADGSDGARQKAVAKTMIAAVVQQGPHADHPASQAIMAGVSSYLKENGDNYRLVAFNTRDETFERVVEMERQVLESIEHENIAAVVLWHAGGNDTLPQILRLIDRNIPVIFVDRCPSSIDCDCVHVDNYGGASIAVEHLIGLHHSRIALVCVNEDVAPAIDRSRAYEDALRAAGLDVDPMLRRVTNYATIQQDMPSLIDHFQSLSNPPTAVFATQDGLAHAIIAAAEAKGWRVPDDLSVVGYDDTDRYSYRPSVLTTIQQPFEQIGRDAAMLLLRRLNEPKGANRLFQQIVLPTRLVVRSTCRAL